MATKVDTGEKLEGELMGEPVVIEGLRVLPVARIQGRVWRGPKKPAPEGMTAPEGVTAPESVTGNYEVGYASVTPVRAVITDANGQEQTVVIRDATGQALRGMGFAALGIAGLCLYLIVMRKLLGQDSGHQEVVDHEGTV